MRNFAQSALKGGIPILALVTIVMTSSCARLSSIDKGSKDYKSGFKSGASLGKYHALVPDPEKLEQFKCSKHLSADANWRAGCVQGFSESYAKTGGLTKPTTSYVGGYGDDDGYLGPPQIMVVN